LVALFLALVVVLLLPLGSRGALMYVFITVAVALCIVRFKMPVIFLYLSTPIVLLVLVFTLFLRAHSDADTFQQYLEIHGSDVLLGGPDYTLAEALIVGMQPDVVPRYPFETLVGMIFAVVPRSLIPWKPEGPSAVFSRVADPERWEITKSEWVITGFINLKVELGVIGAAAAMTWLAWLWARYLKRSTGQDAPRYIVRSTLCIVMALIFIRGDMYGLALFLWPTAIVFGGFRAISRIV